MLLLSYCASTECLLCDWLEGKHVLLLVATNTQISLKKKKDMFAM